MLVAGASGIFYIVACLCVAAICIGAWWKS
jgi:hypothetical protein